jgi:hypothetical protein
MYIEMTRGRSDIYDVLTHLTFMFIEAEKIRKNALDSKDRKNRSWLMLEKLVEEIQSGKDIDRERGYTYLSTLLGRTYSETAEICQRFKKSNKVNNMFQVVYWMGRLSIEEHLDSVDREISFSSELREKLGYHFFGEAWAHRIQQIVFEAGGQSRPVHLISANLHSVMNILYAKAALKSKIKGRSLEDIAELLSNDENESWRDLVHNFALKNGMVEIDDISGTNITVQIFDCKKIDKSQIPSELTWQEKDDNSCPILIVMDYAFGEQAYETMDELLKPYEHEGDKIPINFTSINIMGKAGILTGNKGDIMIPNAHVFEGTADNYPFENALTPEHFNNSGVNVYHGPMISVLGTSLQNKDILRYFLHSSWRVIGLEMEGAHYQKAIQSASKIRKSIKEDIVLRYAYYASDNPLESGSTLASGSLGLDGVKPTYLITLAILNGVFS